LTSGKNDYPLCTFPRNTAGSWGTIMAFPVALSGMPTQFRKRGH
jgi:hypothetical protein